MNRQDLLERAKPILFNTEMVRAILNGQKTNTRRIAKKIIQFDYEGNYFNMFRKGEWTGLIAKELLIELYAPYKIGDYLYVRETWTCYEKFWQDAGYFLYRTDFPEGATTYEYDGNIFDIPKWRPSIHMPKEAARIFLKVTDVRVEHLKDMTLNDFLAEGVVLRPEPFNDPENACWQAREIFSSIWDSTIPKKDMDKHSWDANPWVWVIEFERIEI